MLIGEFCSFVFKKKLAESSFRTQSCTCSVVFQNLNNCISKRTQSEGCLHYSTLVCVLVVFLFVVKWGTLPSCVLRNDVASSKTCRVVGQFLHSYAHRDGVSPFIREPSCLALNNAHRGCGGIHRLPVSMKLFWNLRNEVQFVVLKMCF